MSCFGCCEEDELQKSAESGGPYVVKNPAGNLVHTMLEQCIRDDVCMVCYSKHSCIFEW